MGPSDRLNAIMYKNIKKHSKIEKVKESWLSAKKVKKNKQINTSSVPKNKTFFLGYDYDSFPDNILKIKLKLPLKTFKQFVVVKFPLLTEKKILDE